MRARSLFIGGTASHAGKSWFTTAICRYLKHLGLRVAPFKAQNMSNNSGPCRISVNGSGATYGEIGRAQIVQAAACGIEPETDMNPILLKPHSETGSQVVVNGRIWRDLDANAYYEHFPALLDQVLAAYDRLSAKHDFVVIEGAGSVTEMNLKARDLVNFGLAERIESPALLIADIDRGGVFGSLVGTMSLLTDAEKNLVRSFAVNRFRGSGALFSDGVQILEQKMDRPCLGVFPFSPEIALDDEDAVSLDGPGNCDAPVAIVKLPHVSNFTDFDRISGARWITAPDRSLYDIIILPGTKNTSGDLAWMRSNGLDRWVIRQHAAGAVIIGICGGYQILGESVDNDPGLSLLPVRTQMGAEKVVRPVRAQLNGEQFDAYEIHMGVTRTPLDRVAFAFVNGQPEGIRHGRCFGTYLHDAMKSDAVLRMFKLEPAEREPPYDHLASWFQDNANLKLFTELYL